MNLFFNSEESIPVSLANDVYYIGVAFDPAKPPAMDESVTIQINGTSCTGGFVWNGASCIAPVDGTELPYHSNFLPGMMTHTSYLRYTVPDYTTRLEFSASVIDGTVSTILGTYQSSPASPRGATPIDFASTVHYPLVGDWYIAYSLFSNQAGANYTLNPPMSHMCPNATYVGEYCNVTVTTISSSVVTPAPLIVKPLEQGKWDYYKVTTSAPTSGGTGSLLWVNAATAGGSISDFHIYIRRGAVPLLSSYDYMDCLAQPCKSLFAYSIALNNTQQNYTYYVGIYANVSTSYGIWFNSVCPPNCINNDDDSGECTWDGNDLGRCICDDGYTGLDCTQNTGTLPTQYIVLIIIASLVVLSALIGFFAWAYMQRKREGYSSLS